MATAAETRPNVSAAGISPMGEKRVEIVIPREKAVFWLDRNGRWRNHDGLFRNPRIIEHFHSAIRRDDGGYYLSQEREGVREKVYFPYEDTALFVVDVKTVEPAELILNTRRRLPLDPADGNDEAHVQAHIQADVQADVDQDAHPGADEHAGTGVRVQGDSLPQLRNTQLWDVGYQGHSLQQHQFQSERGLHRRLDGWLGRPHLQPIRVGGRVPTRRV